MPLQSKPFGVRRLTKYLFDLLPLMLNSSHPMPKKQQHYLLLDPLEKRNYKATFHIQLNVQLSYLHGLCFPGALQQFFLLILSKYTAANFESPMLPSLFEVCNDSTTTLIYLIFHIHSDQ